MLALDTVSLKFRPRWALALAAAGLLLLPGASEAWERRGNPVNARLRPRTWRQNRPRFRPLQRPAFQRRQTYQQPTYQAQPTYQGQPSYQARPGASAAAADAAGFSMTQAEYEAIQQAGLPVNNLAQSGNYRIETINIGGQDHQYWLKWERGRITAYELAGGHKTGRYRYFSSNEEFYGWRQGLQQGEDFSAWSQGWDDARYSSGLASQHLGQALGQYRANPPVVEEPPVPEVGAELETEVQPEEEPASASDIAVSGAAGGLFGLPGGEAETETEIEIEIESSPSDRPYDDPAPEGEQLAGKPDFDTDASPSDRPAEEPMDEPETDPVTEQPDPFAQPELAQLRDQISEQEQRREEIGDELGQLAVEENRLSRQVREAKEGLGAWNWAVGLQDRKVQLQRESRLATVERGEARLAEIAEERRRLQSSNQYARTRQQQTEAQLGRVVAPSDDPGYMTPDVEAPPAENPRQVELRSTIEEERTRLAAIDEELGKLSVEEGRLSRAAREAKEHLGVWNWAVGLQDRKVQLQRASRQAQVDHAKRRIPEIKQRRQQLFSQSRAARSRLEQAEAQLGRTLLPN